jgi:hypothetical protein
MAGSLDVIKSSIKNFHRGNPALPAVAYFDDRSHGGGRSAGSRRHRMDCPPKALYQPGTTPVPLRGTAP